MHYLGSAVLYLRVKVVSLFWNISKSSLPFHFFSSFFISVEWENDQNDVYSKLVYPPCRLVVPTMKG